MAVGDSMFAVYVPLLRRTHFFLRTKRQPEIGCKPASVHMYTFCGSLRVSATHVCVAVSIIHGREQERMTDV